jgi:NAD(P)-dependent dehydrogenase (short-subunit alcohol dehydrogenase family)
MLEQSVARIVKKTGRSEADARKMLADINPDGRLLEPQEVADAVLKLCSPAFDRITGQAIAVPEVASEAVPA